MPTPAIRTVAVIDAELHSCRAVSRDAHRELEAVRCRQAELADLEAELLTTIDSRAARMDRLLDERLRAADGARSVHRTAQSTGVVTPV